MSSRSDSILRGLCAFAHETLGLSPNQVSAIGLVFGLSAAVGVAIGHLVTGLILLAISQIIDGVDGGVARMYRLQSEMGKILEVVCDRSIELVMFLALASAGYVSLTMAFLAFLAILLVTFIEPISNFDPGFKRFMIYFGYLLTVMFQVRGFEAAMHVIFIANLAGFAAGTIIVDYRLQREIDEQAILRREYELMEGITPLAEHPPSFLSKLFS